MHNLPHPFEAVIGLEIHAQLSTRTKLFSPTTTSFGESPNSAIGPVDTGAPGSLPTLNRAAVAKSIAFGIGIGSDINLVSYFDRKSYFYPDSPRNYQITQFYKPIIEGGQIYATVGEEEKVFKIKEAHIEDDSGMLKHFSSFAGVDYNRAGTPLLEIVSEACMHSPAEAVAYAKAIVSLLQYTDTSECIMEEGGLRFDANISIRPIGEIGLRPKVEIKNMNSFANLEAALEIEILRQTECYLAHPDLPFQEAITAGTYRYDAEKKKTVLMRRKEEAQDYRYFPEPDLPPLVIDPSWIEEINAKLPELPKDKKERYIQKLGLSAFFANLLVEERANAAFFEKAISENATPKTVATWMLVEFAGRLKEKGLTFQTLSMPALHLSELVKLLEEGKVTGKTAKELADLMVENPQINPRQLLDSHPELAAFGESAQIESWINEVILNHPASVEDYHRGIQKAFNHLLGQVMKKSQGRADPAIVNQLLKSRLDRS